MYARLGHAPRLVLRTRTYGKVINAGVEAGRDEERGEVVAIRGKGRVVANRGRSENMTASG